MKRPGSPTSKSVWILTLTFILLMPGFEVMPARGGEVSQVTFYVD